MKPTAKKVIDALTTAGMSEGTIERIPKTVEEDGYVTGGYTRVSAHGDVNVSEETFGSTSFLFFRCCDMATARYLALILKGIGGKPDFGWNGGVTNLSCEISPIKGFHHWE